MKFKKPQLSFWLFWFAVLSAFLFFLQACKQISKKEKYKADVALAGSSASGESLDLGPAGSQAPVLKIQYENFKASEDSTLVLDYKESNVELFELGEIEPSEFSEPIFTPELKELMAQHKVIAADVLKSGELIDAETKQKLGKGCFQYVIEQDVGSLLIALESGMDKFLAPWEGGWAITAAGDLCTDDQGKIFSFNNKSDYAQPIISIRNFFAFLGLRGLVLAWELDRGNPEEEESPQFGLVKSAPVADLAARRREIQNQLGAIRRWGVAGEVAPSPPLRDARRSLGGMPSGRIAEVAKKQARARQAQERKVAARLGVAEKAGGRARIAEDREYNARLLAKAERRKAKGAAPRVDADARARQEADARARQEADARARQEADARARQEAEARARQEAEARARQEAEARARQVALSAPRVSAQNKQAALVEAMNDVERWGGLSSVFYLGADRIPISTSDKFKFQGRLGAGSFGSVDKFRYYSSYGAIDLAIKTQITGDSGAFMKEVNTHQFLSNADINHEHVLQFLKSSYSNGVGFMLMESATSTIEKNMPSTRESLRNEFVKFLGSLKFMHDNSFVHRDLKPANIFIVDGKIKLGDFGLAEYMRWRRPPGANNIAGTPHTIAPEVWLNPNQADLYRADIYSAGITMAWRAQIASDPAHPDAFTKRVSRYSENFGYGGEMYKVFTYDTSNFRWDFWGGYDQILLNGVRDLRSRKVLVSSEMSRIFRWMTSENIFQRGNLEQRILELHQIKIVLLLHSLKQRWGLLNPKLQQFPVWIQNGLHPPLQAVLN